MDDPVAVEIEAGTMNGGLGGTKQAEGRATNGKRQMHGAGVRGEHAVGVLNEKGALPDAATGSREMS